MHNKSCSEVTCFDPWSRDRVLSTSVECQWDYHPKYIHEGPEYDEIFNVVESAIYEIFAGPPIEGLHSSSVQNALYEIEKAVLQRVPEVLCTDMQENMRARLGDSRSGACRIHAT